MTVSEEKIMFEENTMRLAVSAIFAVGAMAGGFNPVFLEDRAFGRTDARVITSQETSSKVMIDRKTPPKELARIDETPDRHDASGGRASIRRSSPGAIT